MPPSSTPIHRLRLTPHGRLVYEPAAAAGEAAAVALPLETAAEIAAAFAAGESAGLLHLAGLADVAALPPDLAFFRGQARRLVTAVGHLAAESRAAFAKATSRRDLERLLPPPDADSLAAAVAAAPPMPGLEYLSAEVLREAWLELAAAVQERAAATKGGLTAALAAIDPRLHLLGKVTFHLAENRRDEARPFAFLATYAHRLSAAAAVQHLPLAQAVEESADRRDQARLVEHPCGG